MDSLAASLISTFETDIAATVQGVKTVEAVANLPFRELEAGIAEVATKLGYAKVLEQWQKAQAALAVDPAETLTRGSQLIGTVCKHIIDSKGQKVDPKAEMKDLYKAAVNCLGLSPDPKTSVALKSLNTGLVTVDAAQCLGKHDFRRSPPLRFDSLILATAPRPVTIVIPVDAEGNAVESTPSTGSSAWSSSLT